MLRSLRQQAEVSQRELARRVGVAQARISEYERGHRSPSVDRLDRIVRTLGGVLHVRAESGLSAEDRQLLDLHLAMTPEQRLDALRAMSGLRGRARA